MKEKKWCVCAIMPVVTAVVSHELPTESLQQILAAGTVSDFVQDILLVLMISPAFRELSPALTYVVCVCMLHYILGSFDNASPDLRPQQRATVDVYTSSLNLLHYLCDLLNLLYNTVLCRTTHCSPHLNSLMSSP